VVRPVRARRDPGGDPSAEFRKFFNEQIKAYAEMVRIAGIQPE
jgi:hypothetical protein